jgi:hypothetical protein
MRMACGALVLLAAFALGVLAALPVLVIRSFRQATRRCH